MVKSIDVARAWREGNKAKSGNMFTDGITIWSYGTHFPIATKLKNGKILFNIDGYSRSTSKHKSFVERQCWEVGEVIGCSTNEIIKAVNYPDEPIIIKEIKYREKYTSVSEALNYIGKKLKQDYGIKSFPYHKLMKEFTKMVADEFKKRNPRTSGVIYTHYLRGERVIYKSQIENKELDGSTELLSVLQSRKLKYHNLNEEAIKVIKQIALAEQM